MPAFLFCIATHLSSGVMSQLEITLANHLHHKNRAETLKASTHILRIAIYHILFTITLQDKSLS